MYEFILHLEILFDKFYEYLNVNCIKGSYSKNCGKISSR